MQSCRSEQDPQIMELLLQNGADTEATVRFNKHNGATALTITSECVR